MYYSAIKQKHCPDDNQIVFYSVIKQIVFQIVF